MNPRPPRLRLRPIAALLLGLAALAPASAAGREPVAGPDAPRATGPPPAGSPVIATWKGGRLTREELDAWRAVRDPSGTGAAAAPTDDEIRDLVFWESLARIAEDAGLEATRKVRLRLEALRQSVLVPALRSRVVAGVSVSDAEVEALRRAHPEAFHKPRKLKLRNLYERFGEGRPAAVVRARMREIHRELLAGADFAALAKRESESQSAPRGGALGYVDPERLPPPVAAAVRGLAPGEISRPVEHGGGVSIFLCEEIREARAPTPDEVRAKLKGELERRRARKAWEAYREGLFRAASPRIDPSSKSAVLELPGARLDARDLAALVALRRDRTGVAPGPEELEGLLRGWAFGVLAARRAGELGLDHRPEIAAALQWRRVEILAQAELARRVEAALPEPGEADLRRDYEEHAGRYREPAAYDLELIDFGQPDGRDARKARAMVERARAVARKIASGELSFAEAARRYSKHPSASAGGGIGWRSRRQIALWGPTASGAIFQLHPGESTALLHLDSGLRMFALRREREARERPFEEVEPRVRAAWLERKLPDLEAEIRRRHLEAIGLEIRPAAVPPPRVLRWSTATEFDNYGYDVYRGPTAEGPFHRLTGTPIPGAGTSDLPHSYRYEDPTAEPGKVYYYYVESISTSGRRRRLTPVKASRGGGAP